MVVARVCEGMSGMIEGKVADGTFAVGREKMWCGAVRSYAIRRVLSSSRDVLDRCMNHQDFPMRSDCARVKL